MRDEFRIMKQGRFPFDKLVTYYDFEDINKAVDDTEQGRVIKAVLRPSGPAPPCVLPRYSSSVLDAFT